MKLSTNVLNFIRALETRAFSLKRLLNWGGEERICSAHLHVLWPMDSKREEYRRYLERAGILDALTKVLVSLYEEPDKPEDALDYVRKHLGQDGGDDKLEAALARIAELEAENALLKGQAPGE